jgi:hypothetical protein
MTRHDRTWTTQPVAAALTAQFLDDALRRVPAAADLAGRLRDDIGVRLIDILDYIWLPDGADVSDFRAAGWESDPQDPAVLRNPTGLFPTLLVGGTTPRIGFKVEYVHEFIAAQGITAVPDRKSVV